MASEFLLEHARELIREGDHQRLAILDETADGVACDPLANLKRLEESRPGFHWRPRRAA